MRPCRSCINSMLSVQLRFHGQCQKRAAACCALLVLLYARCPMVRGSNDSRAALQTVLRGGPANGRAARDHSGRAPGEALSLRLDKLAPSLRAPRPDLETCMSKATRRPCQSSRPEMEEPPRPPPKTKHAWIASLREFERLSTFRY